MFQVHQLLAIVIIVSPLELFSFTSVSLRKTLHFYQHLLIFFLNKKSISMNKYRRIITSLHAEGRLIICLKFAIFYVEPLNTF